MDNPQIELARKIIETTDTSLFLTGKAGTGKTTFLRRFVLSRPNAWWYLPQPALRPLTLAEQPYTHFSNYHLPPLCLAPPIQKNSAHTA